MRNLKWNSLLTLFFLILLAPPGTAQSHKDKDYGFSIRPPKYWERVERNLGSSWIVGKYISTKATHYNSPEGWTWTYHPEMTLIAFVHDVIKHKGVSKTTDEDGTLTVSIGGVYKNYKDYLQRTYHGGGFYFSEEEDDKLKDVPVTCCEIKVEKLASTGPRRIIAWIYHLEGVDIAVQFEVLEDAYKKRRKEVINSLRSFRVIERSGPLPTGSGDKTVFRLDWDDLTLAERNEKRQELEEEAHQKALDKLPKGWKHCKVGGILVLDNFDSRVAREVAQECLAVRRWLEKKFSYLGPDEYVRAPILKVFEAANSSSFGFSFGFLDNIEIEVEYNRNFFNSFQSGMCKQRMMDLWFYDRARELYWAMPYWMKHGLQDLMSDATIRNNKLSFDLDQYDHRQQRLMISEGKLYSPRELMRMSRTDFSSGRYARDQAATLVRFLLIGAGSRASRTKKLFPEYLNNLVDVTWKIKQEEVENLSENIKPTTEEEEDAYFREKQDSWEKKEKRILEEVFEITFGSWSEKDWKTVDASFRKALKD